MKTFTFFLYFLSTFFVYSQSPDIEDGSWYLIDLHVNSESNFYPLNSDGNPMITEFVTYSGNQRQVETGICEFFFGPVDIYPTNSTITFYGFGRTLGGCTPRNGVTWDYIWDIGSKFTQFFQADNYNANVYSYQIIEENLDQPRALIITDTNGDYAKYYYNTLSTHQKNIKLSFSIYPNPVKDKLSISSTSNLKQAEVHIFDIQGKLIMSKKLTNTKSIDVQNLSKGFYFLQVKDVLGNSVVKKFVK